MQHDAKHLQRFPDNDGASWQHESNMCGAICGHLRISVDARKPKSDRLSASREALRLAKPGGANRGLKRNGALSDD